MSIALSIRDVIELLKKKKLKTNTRRSREAGSIQVGRWGGWTTTTDEKRRRRIRRLECHKFIQLSVIIVRIIRDVIVVARNN